MALCIRPDERQNTQISCDCLCIDCLDLIDGHVARIDREYYAREREREEERTGRRICPRCDDYMWQCADCKTWRCDCSSDGVCYCREDDYW